MNESLIRQRLRAALGESVYPASLTARIAEGLRRPVERRSNAWAIAAVAAVVAVALVLTVVVGVHTFLPRSIPVHFPFVQQPGAASCPGYGAPLTSFVNVKKASGVATAWAEGGLRTTDGGGHWHDVSPATLRSDHPSAGGPVGSPPGFAEFYLDGDHAWEMRTFDSSSTCFDRAVVFVTSDGGKTWQQSETIKLDIKAGTYASPQMDFIDAQHGWMWLATGTAAQATGLTLTPLLDGDLYATTDGGVHWKLVSQGALAKLGLKAAERCAGPLHDFAFESTTVGWITIYGCALSGSDVQVIETRDGGLSWHIRHISGSDAGGDCPCWVQQLTIFDANHAVMSVFPSGAANVPGASPRLLVTADAGLTWRPVRPPQNTGYSLLVDFVDVNTWWDVVTPSSWQKGQAVRDLLYRTTDGGQTWNLVAQDLPLGYPLQGLFFTDADHGMASQPQGATSGASLGQGVEVLTTSDGGRTWKSVIAQVS